MKKKLAFSIAGATAAVIGGWKLVQQLVDRGDESHPAPAPPAPAARPAKPAPGPEPASPDSPDAGKSKAELYEIATEMGIKGRSKMGKKQLLQAIRDAS